MLKEGIKLLDIKTYQSIKMKGADHHHFRHTRPESSRKLVTDMVLYPSQGIVSISTKDKSEVVIVAVTNICYMIPLDPSDVFETKTKGRK